MIGEKQRGGIIVIKKLLVAGLCCFVLFGCSQNVEPSFNEEVLTKAATDVVQSLNVGQYGVITQTVSDELQSALSPEMIESVWTPLIETLGEYQGVVETKVVPNENSAITIVVAEYENGSVQLTMTYNKDMELIGFYMQ